MGGHNSRARMLLSSPCVIVLVTALAAGLSIRCGGTLASWWFVDFTVPADIPDLTGQTAFVTGTSMGGIGFHTALELARANATVVLAGRSPDKVEASKRTILQEVPGAKLDSIILDTSSLASVKAGAEDFLSRHTACHMLVLNAGVMAVPFALSLDGYEQQFATNHLGHFLLTQLLLRTLKESSPSRVVSVSSIGHYAVRLYGLLGFDLNLRSHDAFTAASKPDYDPFWGYARSKFANVIFAQELSRRHSGEGIYANSVHPGVISTALYEGVFHGGTGYSVLGLSLTVMNVVGETLTAGVRYLWNMGCMSPTDGAVTQLYAAASPEIVQRRITGRYLAPQAREAQASSMATLENQEALWESSMSMVRDFL